MHVSVSKVTSDYLKSHGLKSRQKITARAVGEEEFFAVLPDGIEIYCLNDGECAHLDDNEVKTWTVHED